MKLKVKNNLLVLQFVAFLATQTSKVLNKTRQDKLENFFASQTLWYITLTLEVHSPARISEETEFTRKFVARLFLASFG